MLRSSQVHRCCDITCTVALLQDPSTGCIAEGTGPSVIGSSLSCHKPCNLVSSLSPALPPVSPVLYSFMAFRGFWVSFWIVFFQVGHGSFAPFCTSVGHLFNCLNNCAFHLGIRWFTSSGRSAQVHGKSWEIGAFNVDPEAFHIHLALGHFGHPSSFPEEVTQVTAACSKLVLDTTLSVSIDHPHWCIRPQAWHAL